MMQKPATGSGTHMVKIKEIKENKGEDNGAKDMAVLTIHEDPKRNREDQHYKY